MSQAQLDTTQTPDSHLRSAFLTLPKLLNPTQKLINNVVLVSGIQQSDSVIPIYVSILF